MHNKKYIFIDLDGTLIDHETRQVPNSAKNAIKLAQNNGHEVFICTGRPPCLFYGIDKELGIHSYVAANGRVVKHHDDIVYSDTIDKSLIKDLLEYFDNRKIDVALEGMDEYVLQSNHDVLYQRFCDVFHLTYPMLKPNYYVDHDIYQINVFYDKDDFDKFALDFPSLSFSLSNQYGLDVNTKGGLKERGIKVIEELYDISKEDIIVIGDGYNDISMLQYVENSVAMGNAYDEVKKHAKHVTDHINNDGLYNAFKHFKLI